MASSVEKIREAQRASGTATVLAIGTATPPTSSTKLAFLISISASPTAKTEAT